MKIGVISDIHSNLTALTMVLNLLVDCDEIICLGDICSFGTQTNECFDVLYDIPNLTVLKGNHDAYANMFYPVEIENSFSKDLGDYLRTRANSLSAKHHEFINSLPYFIERTIEDTRISFVHFPWADSFESRKVANLPLTEFDFHSNFDRIDSEIVVYGHTHYPHDLKVSNGNKNTRYVNFGPLGVTHDFGPYAHFGIINILPNKEFNVEFKKEKYDLNNTISSIKARYHPYNKFILNKFYNYKD